MKTILDLERYPLDRPQSPEFAALAARCRRDLATRGMCNLDDFVQPAAIAQAAAELIPRCASESYVHRRRHNVYFQDVIAGLPENHSALQRFDTVNHTLCADHLGGTVVRAIYEWPPLCHFLAQVMDKPALFLMEYRTGETLNWHFDRSQYTTTLLLQGAALGGEFEYCKNLRSDADQNYELVGRALVDMTTLRHTNPLSAGTLNVFAGRNTLHRVSTVRGDRSRIVAVFSYYDRCGVSFSSQERRGFYGRDH